MIRLTLAARQRVGSQAPILEAEEQVGARPENGVDEQRLIARERGRRIVPWVGKEFQVPGEWIGGSGGNIKFKFVDRLDFHLRPSADVVERKHTRAGAFRISVEQRARPDTAAQTSDRLPAVNLSREGEEPAEGNIEIGADQPGIIAFAEAPILAAEVATYSNGGLAVPGGTVPREMRSQAGHARRFAGKWMAIEARIRRLLR